ncbi:hypothetical protein PRZ48_005263 [Zasmidium cellare]|uniref:Uncharacterized protein n=1 Tax=Zasmidium cellare TaxID=395010 RepID=A0ABR0ERX3_ZASCE|nr:hypothetical protein PRZ48_005263 [Zasmidium cellare]
MHLQELIDGIKTIMGIFSSSSARHSMRTSPSPPQEIVMTTGDRMRQPAIPKPQRLSTATDCASSSMIALQAPPSDRTRERQPRGHQPLRGHQAPASLNTAKDLSPQVSTSIKLLKLFKASTSATSPSPSSDLNELASRSQAPEAGIRNEHKRRLAAC